MPSMRIIACLFLFTAILGFAIPASATNSPDGASITPSSGGSLVTSAGTWTFSTTTGSGGNVILLNGSTSNGRGVMLTVGNGGQIYDFSSTAHWYEWGGTSWGSALAGTPFPLSTKNSTMTPGGSTDLVTTQGIWAFSTTTGAGGNLILLNGAQANGGSGTDLQVDNGGQMYTLNSSGNWYYWSATSNTWTKTTNPTAAFSPYCTSPVVVGLQWSTVSGAASYKVSRSGITPPSTTLLAYTDKAVAASTTYAYVLTALNSSGGTVSTQNLSVTTPAATTTGDPAYCPSSSIASITPNWTLGIFQADGSDLWSQTLGSDGNQYGFFGDGGGFGGSNSPYVSFGIGAITSSTGGTLTGAENIYGGLNAQHSASKSGKATSILEIGPSNSMDFYALAGISNETSSQTKGGANDQEIVYSTSNAWTWTDNASSWTFCTNGGTSTNFCPTIFLQNGPGYSGNTDGYVYLYGGTENSFFGNGTPGTALTYLWRVPTSQASILSATDYQAVTGWNANGTPVWSTGSISTLSTSMIPVFTDKQSSAAVMGLSEVTYNSALGRYIASAENDVNQVAFYDAPNPWGPWTSIGYYNANPTTNAGGWGNFGAGIATSNWGNGKNGDGLGVNFIDKWMSTNGQTMWVVDASDSQTQNASTSSYLTAVQGQDMDGFIAVPLTVTPAP